jgi:capsular exopolysaccharide synthesis family protein
MAVPSGLVLPFAIFLVWELLAQRVFNSEHLERELDLVIYGEIARLPRQRVKTSIMPGEHHDHRLQLFRESVNSLSTNVALSVDLRDVRVLCVASAVHSEGKTSVAAELARQLSLRSHGERVLLIDGDMRSPDIHRLFHIPRMPGLVDVLEGHVPIDQAIQTGWSDDLHLLPSGHVRSNPVALLNNGGLRTVLDHVLADYRYVVFDTPPILACSEALIFSTAADATLVCVMSEASRGELVRRACRRLQLAGSRNLGLVINGVSVHNYQRRYGAYPYPSRNGTGKEEPENA